MNGNDHNTPTHAGRSDENRPSDEVVLAWIEGELPANEVARLEVEHPRLAFEVRLMRGDRASLRAMPIESAPAELAAKTMAALERESLLRLVASEAAAPSRPVEMRRQPSPSVLARIGPRWGLALAAGLALATGVWGVWPKAKRTVAPVADQPIAMNGLGASDVTALESRTAALTREDADKIKDAAEITLAESSPRAEVHSRLASKAVAPEGDATSAPSAAPLAIAPERLLDLAREGRLVMRVRDAKRPLNGVELAAARDTSKTWRLSKDVPDAVLASLAPIAGPRSAEANEPPIIAAAHVPTDAPQRLLGLTPMQTSLRADWTPTRRGATAYYAEVTADAKSLDQVRTTFASSLGASASFEEVEAPIDLDLPQSVDDVLWWTQSPAAWSPRVTLPVVVTRE